MSTTAIVGAQWGDEGKGRLVDLFAVKSDVVVRYQGGNNAGHTINNQYGRFALHLLPSGAFHSHVTNVIGPGVALNIAALLKEVGELTTAGVPSPNLLISDRAQVLLPYHQLFDAYEEERRGAGAFGSTKSGIAPFYADKAAKIGVQVADLYDDARLRGQLSQAVVLKNALLEHVYHKPLIDLDLLVTQLIEWGQMIKQYVGDSTVFLHEQIRLGKDIVLEGQLGAMKDLDHGIFPYTTSSNTLAGYATVGAGIPPSQITRIIAVVKAYCSCVGAGPYVGELLGEEGNELRNHGGDKGEYGATTGRPRRMAWFDAVATNYGCRVQGATEVALTVVDALGYLDEIPICVGYEIDGKVTTDFPVTAMLDRAKPIYKTLSGWHCGISDVRKFSELPQATRYYVETIEELIGLPIKMISVGPRRDEIIMR